MIYHNYLLSRSQRGFSLGEVLLAILFISIAFFGYSALHQRIIFSGWKTELRNLPREQARGQLITAQQALRTSTITAQDLGENMTLKRVQGVSEGLYSVSVSKTWQDPTRPGKQAQYLFETMATRRRPTAW